jgi:hypothetical protein
MTAGIWAENERQGLPETKQSTKTGLCLETETFDVSQFSSHTVN